MSSTRKIVWIALAIFMFIQVGSSYLIHKNQDNLSFLMQMKGYIPYMLYFSFVGAILFLLSFMIYQLDGIKAKKQIAKLENDKNELKAKLFDMQEAKSSEKLTTLAIKQDTLEETSTHTEPEEDSE